MTLLIFAGNFKSWDQLRFSTLNEVLEYTDRHAIDIQTARLQQKITESKSKAFKAALLPSVNGFAGFNDNIVLQPTLVPANLLNSNAPAGMFKEYSFGKKYVYSAGGPCKLEYPELSKMVCYKNK